MFLSYTVFSVRLLSSIIIALEHSLTFLLFFFFFLFFSARPRLHRVPLHLQHGKRVERGHGRPAVHRCHRRVLLLRCASFSFSFEPVHRLISFHPMTSTAHRFGLCQGLQTRRSAVANRPSGTRAATLVRHPWSRSPADLAFLAGMVSQPRRPLDGARCEWSPLLRRPAGSDSICIHVLLRWYAILIHSRLTIVNRLTLSPLARSLQLTPTRWVAFWREAISCDSPSEVFSPCSRFRCSRSSGRVGV